MPSPYTEALPSTHTLVGTTADSVTFTGALTSVRVINRGATDIWVRTDGTVAVADAAGTYPIPAGASLVLPLRPVNTQSTGNLSIVGNATKYTVSDI